jgi:putative resolvase
VPVLVVAHQDRLARFGFDYLEHVAARNGCEIIVANQVSLSPQQELVEDLLAIVHTFSGRLDGLRRYEQTLPQRAPDARDTGEGRPASSSSPHS